MPGWARFVSSGSFKVHAIGMACTIAMIAGVAGAGELRSDPRDRRAPGCTCGASQKDVVATPGATENAASTITNTSGQECSYSWTVAKTGGSPTVLPAPANGTVTLAAGAVHNFTTGMRVPARTAARDAADVKLTVAGGGNTCEVTSKVCVKPTGENTASNGWSAGARATAHLWKQTLQPGTADFSTRTVTERDPGGGGPDTCWFPGSAIRKFDAITGGTWTVAQGNKWGDDEVGWFTNAVTYYRQKGRAPCGTSFPQDMVIDCPAGEEKYTRNQLGGSMDATGVTSERDGQSETKTWP